MLRRHSIPVVWVDDDARNKKYIDRDSIVFGVNVAAKHLPAVSGARYVLHNLDPTPFVEVSSQRSHVLTIQVWSKYPRELSDVERMLPCISFDSRENVLYQPWGTPFSEAEWIHKPLSSRGRREFWIGSAWNNHLNQGNVQALEEWATLLADRGITFSKVPYGLPDTRKGYGSLVRTSKFAAAIVGSWQRVNKYVPCRVFKNVSFGALPLGNTDVYTDVFGESAVTNESLEDVLDHCLALTAAEKEDRLREAQEHLRHYTYEASFNRILDRIGR